jgi:hypothetical protein
MDANFSMKLAGILATTGRGFSQQCCRILTTTVLIDDYASAGTTNRYEPGKKHQDWVYLDETIAYLCS